MRQRHYGDLADLDLDELHLREGGAKTGSSNYGLTPLQCRRPHPLLCFDIFLCTAMKTKFLIAITK